MILERRNHPQWLIGVFFDTQTFSVTKERERNFALRVPSQTRESLRIDLQPLSLFFLSD